jgi:CRP-like cAMP-binding protein
MQPANGKQPVRLVSPLARQAVEAAHCTHEVKLRILRGLPFLADLTDSDILTLCGSFHDGGYARGKPVYEAGEPASRLFVVAAGKVKLVRTGAAGQSVLVEMLSDGDYFGSLEHLGEERYSDTAVAHVQSCILAVSAQDFQSILARFPSVSVRFVSILAGRLRSAHEKLEMLSKLSVEGRVAFVLLRLAARFGERRRSDTLIQLPLSREELGEMAGTTTESASRVISRFSRDGLIRTGRRWVAVLDRDRLSVAAASQG